MNKSPEKLRTPIKPSVVSPVSSPDRSEQESLRLRDSTTGAFRSPLRQQIESLYKEKRETYQKLLTEIAARKSLEKQVAHLESRLMRDAGATYERWKDEKENRDVERENMQALQQEFDQLKVKCAEYKIESQDWKTKYEKTRIAFENERWASDEVKNILAENRALRESLEDSRFELKEYKAEMGKLFEIQELEQRKLRNIIESLQKELSDADAKKSHELKELASKYEHQLHQFKKKHGDELVTSKDHSKHLKTYYEDEIEAMKLIVAETKREAREEVERMKQIYEAKLQKLHKRREHHHAENGDEAEKKTAM